MNRLSTKERTAVITLLAEGMAQRAIVRATGTCKKAVARLAVEVGEACERFADRVMVNLPCRHIQCDEIWQFVGCKERQKEKAKLRHPGDVWTWVAIDPVTKLIPRWYAFIYANPPVQRRRTRGTVPFSCRNLYHACQGPALPELRQILWREFSP